MIDVGLVGFGFAGRTFHAPVISAVEATQVAAAVMTSYHRNLIAGRLPARALCTAIGGAADGGEVAPFNLFGAGL